ncbi:hypothetical protein STEG23_022353, partial [Scotinomys teguina]
DQIVSISGFAGGMLTVTTTGDCYFNTETSAGTCKRMKHPSNLGTLGECEGNKPTDPKQQDLQHTGHNRIPKRKPGTAGKQAFKCGPWGCEMALQIKVLVARPDDLNFISGTYMVEGDDHLLQGNYALQLMFLSPALYSSKDVQIGLHSPATR